MHNSTGQKFNSCDFAAKPVKICKVTVCFVNISYIFSITGIVQINMSKILG